MKTIITIVIASLLLAADAQACELYRGQAWLYPNPLDGTYALNDNAVLYAYALNDDGTQTFTFGTLLAADVQTLTIAPDNVIWFSKEDVYPNCQFSLGYQLPQIPAPKAAAPRVKKP